MSPLRFCHVSTFYPPYHYGGDAILAQAICEGLAHRGHEVTIVHSIDAYQLRSAPPGLPAVDPPGVRRVALQSRFATLSSLIMQQSGRPGLVRRALRHVFDESYDVVHFHNVSLIGGPGVFPMSNAPVTLHTTHDHWLFCATHVLWKDRNRPCDTPTCFSCSLRSGIPPQAWRWGAHVARSLESVDCLLAPSAYTAERHRRAGVTRPIRVLPSFSSFPVVDTPTSTTATRFVYAGRLVISKGIEDLLEAVATRPTLRLEVVGDGPLGPALRERYRDVAHITFRASVAHAEMASVFAGATAVVVPSWGPEVFALTVIEAMACGVPVVVRRAGGSAETIERTGGGLVYDEPHELPALLERLASDAAMRETLAARARIGVQTHYAQAQWFDTYLGIIEEIAASKRARPRA